MHAGSSLARLTQRQTAGELRKFAQSFVVSELLCIFSYKERGIITARLKTRSGVLRLLLSLRLMGYAENLAPLPGRANLV